MTDSLAPSVAGAPGPATVPPFDQVGVAIAPGDDLVRQGFTKKIGPGRSTSQWWKWVRNKQI